MSTDLEFPKSLPQIHLPSIQIPSSPKPTNSDSKKTKPTSDNGCRTPTSEENKIPKILSCPGAPRKPRTRPAVSCKRKLTMELQFFEIVNQEEVDAFFRSAFDLGVKDSSPVIKKSCRRPA